MKRITTLLLAVSLCLSLVACGSTRDPDQDYVLALMEKGDYAMAIKVLENLQNQADNSTDKATTEATEAIPTAKTTEPPMSEQQMMVLETVNRFMEEKGNDLVAEYESVTCSMARKPVISHAMEYRLGNWDGFPVHFLLIYLDADIAYTDPQGIGVGNDNIQVLLDLDSGILYDSTMIPMELPSSAANIEEVCLRAASAYHAYVIYNAGQLWTDSEIREELTDADLAAINAALN